MQKGDAVKFIGRHCARTKLAGLNYNDTYIVHNPDTFGGRITLEDVKIDGAHLLLFPDDVMIIDDRDPEWVYDTDQPGEENW